MGGLEYKSSLHCQEGGKDIQDFLGGLSCPHRCALPPTLVSEFRAKAEVGRLVSMLLLFSCKVMSDCLKPHGL